MTSKTEEQRRAGRTQARQPKDTATARAQAQAAERDANGTNKQAGAGFNNGERARQAQTQPERETLSTTPAPKERPPLTKPYITNPHVKTVPPTAAGTAEGAARKPPSRDGQGQPDTATPAAGGGGNKTTAVIFWTMQGGAPYRTNDLVLAKKLWPDKLPPTSAAGVEY